MSMDIESMRSFKRKEPLNLVTGVFLKSVYFLDKDLSKCVILGFFRGRGDSLGILFNTKKGYIYWSHDVFNQFAPRFNEVTVALESKKRLAVTLDTKEDIKVKNVFGKQHVYLYDGEHSLSLTESDWSVFINFLPLIYREVGFLFMNEDLVKSFIRDLLCTDQEDIPIVEGLLTRLADRLVDEVLLYKRWPNGGNS